MQVCFNLTNSFHKYILTEVLNDVIKIRYPVNNEKNIFINYILRFQSTL